MGTKQTGFMDAADLGRMVKEAERADDAEIRAEGIRIGYWYHIRPTDYDRRAGDLQTGNYKVTAVIKISFKVAGKDRWFPFIASIVYVFSYMQCESCYQPSPLKEKNGKKICDDCNK